MKAGEKLSFLTVEEQEWVLEAIDNAVLTVTDKQAELFKNHSREKTLNQGIIYSVLLQKKESRNKGNSFRQRRYARIFRQPIQKSRLRK